ncbi:MAG: hypothetical protein DRI69_05270 [Bacteroidetes bacterium]|nr:MAG: hypothetical protein DRI69_05270 [Bacteroidota bacterium]
MKNRISVLIIILIATGFIACNGDDVVSNSLAKDWSIPLNEVRDGGPGKDGIPALENPEMITANQATYIDDDDLVIGYIHGDEVRAYPHKILDWHEIINDEINGLKVAITYCPLTGTAIGWNRTYDGKSTTFGVSGLLYNSNLMPYDRTTNSTWTQQGLLSVNGPLRGTEVRTFQVLETKWSTWQAMYPQTTVVSLNTGHSRNYQQYPYGSYRETDGLIFSVSTLDDRLPQKERVHGVIVNGNVKVYRVKSFTSKSIITENIHGEDIVVVGSTNLNFVVSFKQKELNGEVLELGVVNKGDIGINDGPSIVLKDQFNNEWDLFGRAISGPDQGAQMEPTNSFIGFWFSWAPFYANPEIYGN